MSYCLLFVQSDYDVCSVCGSMRECAHDREDVGNHGNSDKIKDTGDIVAASSTVTREQGQDYVKRELENNDDDDCYEMVSNVAIFPGNEVFNTYGEKLSNAQLLVQYGFAIDGNEHDSITWDLEELEEIFGKGRGSDGVVELWAKSMKEWTDECRKGLTDSRLVYSFDGGRVWTRGSRSAFRVNEDGKISDQLWLYCALLSMDGAESASESELVKVIRDVVDLQVMLEREVGRALTDDDEDGGVLFGTGYFQRDHSWRQPQAQARFSRSSPTVVIGLIQMVQSLCDAKKGGLGKVGAKLESLGDVADVRAESFNLSMCLLGPCGTGPCMCTLTFSFG